MKIQRKFYWLTSVISMLIALSAFYSYSVIHIISLLEMLEILFFFGGSGIVALIFSKNDLIGQCLSGKKPKVEKRELIAIAIVSIGMGMIALCVSFFAKNTDSDHKLSALIFGISFMIGGLIILIKARKKIENT